MGKEAVKQFIARWKASGAAERANCQSFLSELCALLDVAAQPSPPSARPKRWTTAAIRRDKDKEWKNGKANPL